MKPGLVGKKRQEVEENEKREKGSAYITGNLQDIKTFEFNKGFNIYLGGANNERITDQLKREKMERVRHNSSHSKERKAWGQPRANDTKSENEV